MKTHAQKHTPGPWGRNIPPATKYCTIYAGRNTHVARIVADVGADQAEGNANLIAAAPDMLQALQRLVHPMADDSDVENARAVIARALGQ